MNKLAMKRILIGIGILILFMLVFMILTGRNNVGLIIDNYFVI